MSNGNRIERRGFEPRKTKEKSPEKIIEESEEEKEDPIKIHLDSVKNSVLAAISESPKEGAKKRAIEGTIKWFFLGFFEKAERQLKEGGGPELRIVLMLKGDKELRAIENSKLPELLRELHAPPKEINRSLETKETKKGKKGDGIDLILKMARPYLEAYSIETGTERRKRFAGNEKSEIK